MNILINFSMLKKGGGQNVALNFLYSLKNINTQGMVFYFIVAKNSRIHQFVENKYDWKYSVFPSNPVLRILCELLFSGIILKKNKIEIIYSYFGYGMYPCKIPQITCSADSNLYYPEYDFWREEGYKGLNLFLKKIIDWYRISGLKRASGIIFETRYLENRCHELYKPSGETITISPSIDLNLSEIELHFPQNIQIKKKGLFLCDWHLNKNVMLIPEIAFHLKKQNIDFHFILTASKNNSSLSKQFYYLVNKHDVADYITVTGQIKKEELYSLYQQIDIVMLISKLESFSNNIIEAWTYRRPVIITDITWARSICEDAALYVNRDNAKIIAENIDKLLNNKDLYKTIVDRGLEKLKFYPQINEKTIQEFEFIRKIYENRF